MKAIRHFQVLILFGAFFSLNFSAIAQTADEDLIQRLEKDFIHRGDLIDVDILGSSEFDWRGTLTRKEISTDWILLKNPFSRFVKQLKKSKKASLWHIPNYCANRK